MLCVFFKEKYNMFFLCENYVVMEKKVDVVVR